MLYGGLFETVNTSARDPILTPVTASALNPVEVRPYWPASCSVKLYRNETEGQKRRNLKEPEELDVHLSNRD